MTIATSEAAFEAAGRLGAIEVLSAQISVIVLMLHAMYTVHPEPERVRRDFDRLVSQLLASPYIAEDPDRTIVLRDIATTLLSHPLSALKQN